MRAQGDAKTVISAERASHLAFDQLDLALRQIRNGPRRVSSRDGRRHASPFLLS